ncbi:MAG: hypothetical protein RIT81_41040 [Deltaproteobacteria bacterium]
MKTNTAGTNDIRLLAQSAMQQAAQAQEEDLRMVIDEIQTNSAKKAEIRELQRLTNQFEDAVKQYYEGDQSAADLEKMKSALSELRTAIKDAGYGENSDLFLATIAPDGDGQLGAGTYGSINENSDSYFNNLNDLLDGESERLGDIGDEMQVKMQMAMTTLNTAQKTASDVLKAWGDNLKAIANNIKP